MSTILELADAVVAAVNAGAFGTTVEAVRAYQPTYELQDLQALKFSVMPRSLTITTAARASCYFDCAIDIAVQKKVNPDQPAELDALMELVAQLIDHLRMKRLEAAPDAAWLSIASEPVFVPEHLEQWRQFTSVLTVTYRVRR